LVQQPGGNGAVHANGGKALDRLQDHAAGAIPPQNAFRYVFSHGADFVLAGMFDFEIAEDTKIAAEAFTRTSERARPWRA